MSNTLTGLIPTLYDSVDSVSRELVGMIPAVSHYPKAEQVAKDQEVTYPVSAVQAVTDVTPGQNAPTVADQTDEGASMTINNVKKTGFYYTGEEMLSLGPNGKTLIQLKFEESMRALTNLIEADLAGGYVSASRAYGTAGTTPFATAGDFSDAAEVIKILKDNGAPQGDIQLVVDTSAGAKILGKQARADIQGGADMLRRGVLVDIHGAAIRESSGIKNHVRGTANTAYDTNGTGAIGGTTVSVDTGTGTILAGDIVTFAGDTNKYVNATALAAGDIVLNNPGLLAALADGVDVTIGAAYAASLAFSRSAIHLLTRLPKMPEGGDMADDVYEVVDPVSGLAFQVALYRRYRQVYYEIAIAWGKKVVRPEHTAILLG